MTLDIISHDLLEPTRHGFFGRKGGASSGIFAGLNCGAGSSDQKDIVAINRARVADAMGVERTNLVTVHQTHSADAIVVDGPLDAPVEADGIVTRTPGIAIAILTADCQPVLFHDPEAGVIGAAHAGWKGAVSGILDATLDAMESIGATRANIRALIGPTISQRAYEVGPEFFDNFIADDADNTRFFAQGNGDRMLFDLPSYGLHRLRSAGVGEAQWTGHCTYSDADRFYSFRRTCHAGEADYGRLISAIRL
ncbi:peptidoglycan editing factor PgeF [Donghicola sp. C2-DW-16]|uniref:Purine nucleoside phosphorylase n=1 Tax=Donghicola mangrovi TaxID=2729614 RepID=A0A850QE33_9RHOB|nr:peptidoglycan editing factor PgeF [Donghicola mangrovi]NVO24131.1 peptidoglycan editing factor PgeF [Donghicola mangrovi]NVO28258.1 peptidoglycan editing factor PgeF [Donghicola mangrovi]